MSTSLTVTRVEIAAWLDGAFEAMPLDEAQLLELARDRGAPPDVLSCLELLPSRRFEHLRDLWEVLPPIPIGD